MEYKSLVKTLPSISVLGHGTWGMGGMWGPRDDRQAIESLLLSFENNINFIDTALAYGKGHSEGLVSSALKKKPKSQDIVVATKVPPYNHKWPGQSDSLAHQTFPKDHVISCTEQSLKNLKLEALDLQQFHVWHDDWLEYDGILEAIHALKKSGKIKAFGVSINDHAPQTALKLVESGLVDTVQVIYNIFDQSPEDELFPLCEKHKVGVIARVPFDEGGLTGAIHPQTTFHKKDWRHVYFTPERLESLYQKVTELKKIAYDHQMTLPELALRFCLSHKAVTTVIPGMRKSEHILSNLEAIQKGPLPTEILKTLKKHRWIRNFYPFQ